jgi:MoaA/NifB/PqqE/SkfB family radical SAM enzyme
MFRISQYMQELKAPLADPQQRTPAGPVVIWNLIRRCNLTCKHCYSISADIDFPGELNTQQVFVRGYGRSSCVRGTGADTVRW